MGAACHAFTSATGPLAVVGPGTYRKKEGREVEVYVLAAKDDDELLSKKTPWTHRPYHKHHSRLFAGICGPEGWFYYENKVFFKTPADQVTYRRRKKSKAVGGTSGGTAGGRTTSRGTLPRMQQRSKRMAFAAVLTQKNLGLLYTIQ